MLRIIHLKVGYLVIYLKGHSLEQNVVLSKLGNYKVTVKVHSQPTLSSRLSLQIKLWSWFPLCALLLNTEDYQSIYRFIE